MSRNLTSRNAIVFKGICFLILGLLSGGFLLGRIFSFTNLVLLGITVWSFCRFYYFAFYVIEKYVDSDFKFTGLTDFARYLMGSRRQ